MPIPVKNLNKARPLFIRRTPWLLIFLLVFGALNIIAQTKTVYKIQVASHPREYPIQRIQSDLGIDSPLTMHYINGRYKYFYGAYPTRAAAEADLSSVPVQGAWVVAVQVDSQTAETELTGEDELQRPDRSLGQQEAAVETEQETITEMVYRVQVAADRRFIDPERIKSDKGLSGYDLDYKFINGYYKYFVGDFETMAEAEQFKNSELKQGFVVLAPVDRVVIPEEAEVAQDNMQEELTRPTREDTTQIDTLQTAYPSQYARWIEWGDQAFETERYEEARGYYQQSLQYDPDQTYPQTRIAQIDEILGQKKQTKISKRLRLFLIIIIVFTLILVAALIFTLIMRTRRKNQEKRSEELKDEIQDSVTEYLFDENATHPEKIGNLKSPRDKQDLIDEIMQLYANLSGEISNRLRELYIDLGLDNESVQKTQSPQWHIRAKGFRELAQMNIKTVNEEIENCLNSENDVLRMEAQLAMIRLNYEDPFSFLDKLEKPFTSWEQLHVFEMINRHQIPVPDFSQWLNSRNETVVVFSLRMIRAFKQGESYEKLYPLMDNQNEEIREEAIISLGELRMTEALPKLREKYQSEDQSGQLLILQAMSKMPEEENIDFLQSVLEPSNALRLEAAEALSRIESFGVKGIETILRRSDDDLQAVARHILDSKTR